MSKTTIKIENLHLTVQVCAGGNPLGQLLSLIAHEAAHAEHAQASTEADEQSQGDTAPANLTQAINELISASEQIVVDNWDELPTMLRASYDMLKGVMQDDDEHTQEQVARDLMRLSADLVRQHWDNLPLSMRKAYTDVGNMLDL